MNMKGRIRRPGRLMVAVGFIILLVAGCQVPGLGTIQSDTPTPTEPANTPTPLSSSTPTVAPTATPTPTATATPTPSPTPAPALRLQLAREAARIGDIETAIDQYRALIDTPNLTEEALFSLGQLYEQEERWDEARDVWNLYLTKNPGGKRVSYVHFRLGQSYAALGKHERAIAHFLAYDIERDVADDVVAQALGRSLREIDRPDVALAQYERAYNHPSADRVARALTARTIADIHVEQEEWETAAEWFQRSLDDSRIAWYRAELIGEMANAHQEAGNLDEAIALWQDLIADYPDTPQAFRAIGLLEDAGEPTTLFERGIVYYENGEWDSAVASMYDSIEEEEDIAEAHWYAALAYRDAGNLEAAWNEFGTLIETHPESDLRDEAWLERARLRTRQNDTEAALQVYARITSDFPDSEAAATALWESAQLLADTDEPTRAALLYLDLADTYPDDDRATRARWEAGLLYYRTGRYDRAQTVWQSISDDSGMGVQARYWMGKAAAAAGEEETARDYWQDIAGDESYYALRAQSQLSDMPWIARRVPDIDLITSQNDIDWLREHLDLAEDEAFDPLAVPEMPELERGDELDLLGMPAEARTAYRQAVDTTGDPQALYALTHHFQTSEPAVSIAAARALLIALDVSFDEAPASIRRFVYPLHFRQLLQEEADTYDIDPLLLAALIYQESRWQPAAQSVAAARGLTQVIPATGEWIAQQLGEQYSDRRLYRPMVSLRYGAFFLDWVLSQADDNPFYALAGYNGGPGNIDRWREDDDVDLFVENITLSETRAYVELVYQHWHAYDSLYR